MKSLMALTVTAAFLGLPHTVHAPVVQWLPTDSTPAQAVPNTVTTAALLRSVGDHIARLAFVSDPIVRRHDAASLAQELHVIAAGTRDRLASNLIRRLAAALARYDLLEIAAASEQRRIMELKFQQGSSAEADAGANLP
jgi:hypothetical protein